MKRLVIILAVFLLVCSTVSVVSATSVNFEIGSVNSIVPTSTGLYITSAISPSLTGNSFSLDLDGIKSNTFDYANILEIDVAKDAVTPFTITANLSFELPEYAEVSNDGTGKIVQITGHCSKTIDVFEISFNSVDVYFGNGGLFTVQLSDFTAYQKNRRCSSGDCYFPSSGDATITAKVTLKQAPISVPEPTTFMLFGTVLIGAIGIRRFK